MLSDHCPRRPAGIHSTHAALPANRSLSPTWLLLCRRKPSHKSGAHSVLEVEVAGDVLDASAASPRVPRQGSKHWGILARGQRDGMTPPAAAGAAGEQACEMAAACVHCMRQGAELQASRRQLGAAQAAAAARQQLNLQHFKYELLVDLWALRVLDNEEQGSRLE